MEPRIGRDEREVVRDSFEAITETGTLDVWDLVTHVDSTDGTITITLPSVEAARGKIYTITCETFSSNITISDAGDDTIFTTALIFTAVDNYAVLYSNGTRWFVLVSVIV